MTDEPVASDDEIVPNQSIKPKRHLGLWVFLLLLLILLISYVIKLLHVPLAVHKKPTTVVLNIVQKQDVPIYISAIGNVTAIFTVTIKTQINGLLMQVLFKEGQLVKKGDLLAQIDERPLLALLSQYQGQLVRDEALLANALTDRNRYQRLWKQDSISQQTLATQEALVRQYQGAVQIDQGLIASTKVNLMYCRIISPIDGRVGLRQIDPGNFVQTSDPTGIVVITTLNPITVIFTVSERDLPQILPRAFFDKNIKVEAYDRRQNKLMATGVLLTIDNQIDTTTGTVKLRAIFDNKEHRLFANQFVNIKLLVSTMKNATTVTTAAIQHGSQGDFVYLLKSDFTVTSKAINTGATYGDSTVVLDGLSLGQQVVVNGADKLVNGAKVRIAENRDLSGKIPKKIRGIPGR
ncbi:MAG: efflux RND transporter periplasmic adaptor subunit [Tatlockia sp.]|nr:efflux RND transporter periplasmic adaptor subunit [Tatlockia sp.]